MNEIFPNLYIGNYTDLWFQLYAKDKPGESVITAVLDCTSDLPTRKWHRAKHVSLRKIGFGSNQEMPPNKLKSAIEYIHEYRSQNKAIMVACRRGWSRAPLVCIAYLMLKKDLTWDTALIKLNGGTLAPYNEAQIKSVTNFVINQRKKQTAKDGVKK